MSDEAMAKIGKAALQLGRAYAHFDVGLKEATKALSALKEAWDEGVASVESHESRIGEAKPASERASESERSAPKKSKSTPKRGATRGRS